MSSLVCLLRCLLAHFIFYKFVFCSFPNMGFFFPQLPLSLHCFCTLFYLFVHFHVIDTPIRVFCFPKFISHDFSNLPHPFVIFHSTVWKIVCFASFVCGMIFSGLSEWFSKGVVDVPGLEKPLKGSSWKSMLGTNDVSFPSMGFCTKVWQKSSSLTVICSSVFFIQLPTGNSVYSHNLGVFTYFCKAPLKG